MERSDLLDLPEPPIAAGNCARIYPHPVDPAKIVKVCRTSPERGMRGAIRDWKLRRKFRNTHRLHARAWDAFCLHRTDPPVPRVFGTAATRLGTGLVIERIGGEAADLAPDLETLARTGNIEAAQRQAVLDLMTTTLTCGVVLPDLSLDNLVWGTARGRTRAFIVDGFECYTFVPNYGWNRRFDMHRMQRLWLTRILAPLGIAQPAGRADAPQTGQHLPGEPAPAVVPPGP